MSEGTAVRGEAGTMLAGRYRLEERIGSGGAGTVWRATDTVLARRVAIKLLHPALQRDEEAAARFRREATAAAALANPNAVVIYDIVHDDEAGIHLVMELVEGPTLTAILEPGPLTWQATAALGYQVASALADAHGRGLVHRDVKPANVLITPDGLAKVADFGIAKAVGTAQSRLTVPGTVMGTATYVAPEQLQDQPVDVRADVYALGLVLHECLTGRPAFGSGTSTEVAARRLTSEPPPPRQEVDGLPPELDAVIVRATRRDPERRFDDAGALVYALESLVEDRGTDELARLVRARTGEAGGDETAVLGHPLTGVDRHVDDTRVVGLAAGTTADLDATSTGARPRRWLGVGIGAALMAAALVGAVLVAGGGDPSGEPNTGAPSGPKLHEIAGVQDFDPLGDGSEHPEDLGRLLDSDPGTVWNSQIYNSRDFGGLKTGVGLWFDLGAPREVWQLHLDTPTPGFDVEVYALDGPPGPDPSAWGEPAARAGDVPSQPQLDTGRTKARYWLVWLTRLPEGGRAQIGGARFLA